MKWLIFLPLITACAGEAYSSRQELNHDNILNFAGYPSSNSSGGFINGIGGHRNSAGNNSGGNGGATGGFSGNNNSVGGLAGSVATGGVATAGSAGSATGGTFTGGSTTGGGFSGGAAGTSGSFSGGNSTGGLTTGGSATGGTSTGGVSTGGQTSGGTTGTGGSNPGINCAVIPAWVRDNKYKDNELVYTMSGGSYPVYQCTTGAETVWCGQRQPGVDIGWQSAWTQVGYCAGWG